MENTATPATTPQLTQEELLQVKSTVEQAASEKLHRPIQTHLREFKRNFDRNMRHITKTMGKITSAAQVKLEAANTWYLGNFLYTIWGGAFVGSVITCASIIFQYMIGTMAVATALQVVGATVFLVPLIVFTVYWAIQWIINSIKGLVNLAKDGLEFFKTTAAFKRANPEKDPLATAEQQLKTKLGDNLPATTSGY